MQKGCVLSALITSHRHVQNVRNVSSAFYVKQESKMERLRRSDNI